MFHQYARTPLGSATRITGATFLASALTMTLASASASAAESADSYPSKPVRLIVAQGIGSSVDTLSRIIGTQLGELWGKQLITDNRGGAGGIIGAEIASRAAPDGYTLLISSTAMQVISPQLYKKLNYHPINDFTPFAMLALTQNILVCFPNMPFQGVKDVISYAKANPGKINMANAGSGFQSHLAGVLFSHMAGIDVRHIPYKGGTSVMNVISGESHLTLVPGPSVMTHVRSNRVRALGTGGEKRQDLHVARQNDERSADQGALRETRRRADVLEIGRHGRDDRSGAWPFRASDQTCGSHDSVVREEGVESHESDRSYRDAVRVGRLAGKAIRTAYRAHAGWQQ
jgi:tripartite-type tricarboxylate transporter receptor subunit TctC